MALFVVCLALSLIGFRAFAQTKSPNYYKHREVEQGLMTP